MSQSPLYDRDFHAWANQQAALLETTDHATREYAAIVVMARLFAIHGDKADRFAGGNPARERP